MIYYITSPTYKEVISSVISENEELLLGGCEEGEDILLYSFIKANNATAFSSIDCIVIDLNACADIDERIIEALEMLRMTNDDIRIILLATMRHPGDALLTQCFQMAIYDIICTDDFLEIREELKYCLTKGKQYKDALQFKNVSKEQVVVKTEVKKTVNKVMLGIVGTQRRIGSTHNSMILANWLRKNGYMVALAELNQHPAFDTIASNMELRIAEDGAYTHNGVDYYPNVDESKLATILGKSYNFIIIDFGCFAQCDRVSFNKCDVRIVVAGAKAWEMPSVEKLFSMVGEIETLKGYHYCFNLTPEAWRVDCKEGMGELEHVYFLEYTENPYVEANFAGAEQILKEYMPDKPVQQKKSLLPFKRKEK